MLVTHEIGVAKGDIEKVDELKSSENVSDPKTGNEPATIQRVKTKRKKSRCRIIVIPRQLRRQDVCSLCSLTYTRNLRSLSLPESRWFNKSVSLAIRRIRFSFYHWLRGCEDFRYGIKVCRILFLFQIDSWHVVTPALIFGSIILTA